MMDEKAIEAAARELCRLRGIDPDGKFVSSTQELGGTRITYSPYWVALTHEVRAFMEVQQAVQSTQNVHMVIGNGMLPLR